MKALVLTAMVAALLVSGCGRRGPLEPPPGSPQAVAKEKAAQASQTPLTTVAPAITEGESSTLFSPQTDTVFGSSAIKPLNEESRIYRSVEAQGNPVTGNKKGRGPLRPQERIFLDALID